MIEMLELAHQGREREAGLHSQAAEPEITGPTLITSSKAGRVERPPASSKQLIGRESDLGRVHGLLASNRLITLTGPGGVGKTVLAIEAARDSACHFSDGVVFVPLASVRDPALVFPAIARAAGLPRPDSIATGQDFATHLGDRRQLLVLDNLEQVVDCGMGIATILTLCPRLKILATSRLVLNLQDERVFQVPPLSLPPAGRVVRAEDLARSAAMMLFVQRAQAVDSNFTLDDNNCADIAQICLRLDGLPLAIELAAARVRILSPAALLPRLGHRLPLLTGGPRDLPARQQTLRDTVAWSYNLLSPQDQAVFRRLSVFVGGFTLDGAEAIGTGTTRAWLASRCVLEVISTLADHSLIRKIEHGPEPRYEMFETIREFGLEMLESHGELEGARRRHAEWIAGLARQFRPGIKGVDGSSVLDQCEREHPNIRAALAYAVEAGDAELGSRLAAGISTFWGVRSHLIEGQRWIERILALPGQANPAYRLESLCAAGELAYARMDADGVRRWGAEGLALARDSGYRHAEARMLVLLGLSASLQRDYATAARYLDEAMLPILHSTDQHASDAQLIGMILIRQAEVALLQGELGRACESASAADAVFRKSGDLMGGALAIEILAVVAMAHGELAVAGERFRQSLSLYWNFGNQWGVADCLAEIGIVAVKRGQWAAGVRLFAIADRLRREIGSPAPRVVEAEFDRALVVARAELGSQRFDAAWQAGGALSLDEAVAEATTLRLDQPPKRTTRFELTPRELEVLRLVAEGRCDREIADMLYVTYRTVTSHIQHILKKLGVDSRTAAASHAFRHGLV